jgi:hypothetical protein
MRAARVGISVVIAASWVALSLGLCPGHMTVGRYLAWPAWLLMSLATLRFWARGWADAIVAAAVAALSAAVWSVGLVDHPALWLEHASPGVAWVVVGAPVVLCLPLGFALRGRAVALGAMGLTLGLLGALPAAIWNVDQHVVGGWRAYPYPSMAGGLISVLAAAVMGGGAAFLGSVVRGWFERGRDAGQ